MQRFYIPNFEKEGIFILNDKDIFHQLVKVLRVREGEKIIFFDGIKNVDFVYEIVGINKKDIELQFLEEVKKETELEFELNLFQAMPNKLEKIEYILQKGVEIGIKKFIFYRSERSQKLIISDKKEERLKKIIAEAVEQSGRSFVPEFEILSSSPFIEKSGKNENIFLHTKNNNSQSLQDFIKLQNNKKTESINIYIGPEGGFGEDEIDKFEINKFSRIHLGNRILRTETAGIVVGFTLGQML